MHIVDRRLNPGSKSLENRQRFLRRAKALVQGAVKKSSEDRDIKDVLEGGEVSIPLDGMNEPRFRREDGTRDMVLPGNKKFIEGDMLPRSGEGRGSASEPGEGDSEDAFRAAGIVPPKSNNLRANSAEQLQVAGFGLARNHRMVFRNARPHSYRPHSYRPCPQSRHMHGDR